MEPVFTKATRKRVLLRMAISGPSGSGKTYTALSIGQGIAAATGLRLAVLDTENGSAEKYADLFDFDHLVMANYAARNYIAAIAAAQDGQHSVLVIDSLSHAWSGIGGTLDTVDRYASGHRGDSFGGWREARPEQRELVDAMLKARLHVIVTMRSKQAYEMEKDERGKTHVRKIGLKPEQTDGIEYEFDVAGDMAIDHRLTITKTRAPALNDRAYHPPGADLLGDLLEWIKPAQGVPEAPEPAAVTEAPAAPAPTPAAAPAQANGDRRLTPKPADQQQAPSPTGNPVPRPEPAPSVNDDQGNSDQGQHVSTQDARSPAEMAADAVAGPDGWLPRGQSAAARAERELIAGGLAVVAGCTVAELPSSWPARARLAYGHFGEQIQNRDEFAAALALAVETRTAEVTS